MISPMKLVPPARPQLPQCLTAPIAVQISVILVLLSVVQVVCLSSPIFLVCLCLCLCLYLFFFGGHAVLLSV